MTTVYLALGSNVGDSRSNIAQAITLLSDKLVRIECAPLYTSKAVGYTDQPDFINTAIKADTELTPLQLLTFIKEVEQQVGRIERFRWGPREIDIDIILYNGTIHETKDLTIPHPSFRERDFVLIPLNDLNPHMIDPITNWSVKKLLNDLSPTDKSILHKLD